jgi:hypothetical protein
MDIFNQIGGDKSSIFQYFDLCYKFILHTEMEVVMNIVDFGLRVKFDFFNITVPKDNPYNSTAGTCKSIASCYLIIIKPLPA